jgi:hypothetical protein
MGGGKSIDWNPMNSTLGTALKGDVGKAWEQTKSSLDPRQSTAAQLLSGNTDTALQQMQGGAQDLVGMGQDLYGAALSGGAGVRGQWESKEAAQRRANDMAGLDAQNQQNMIAQQGQEQERTRAEAEKKNQDYLASQAKFSAGEAEMDALTRARKAARKAKGQSLFGAWEA